MKMWISDLPIQMRIIYPDANNYHQKWKLQLLLEAILRVPASQIRQYL